MTKWLEHREKIQQHSVFIKSRDQEGDYFCSPSQNTIGAPHACTLTLKMAQTPSKARVLFDVLARDYGTLDFHDALADFIAQVNGPDASGLALQHHDHNTN